MKKVNESILETKIRQRKSNRNYLVTFAIVIILFISFLVLSSSGMYIVKVDGTSMVPTLLDSDKLIVSSSAEPNYGDIIIVSGKNSSDIIKRLIGKPGDTIQIRGGLVKRNGLVIDEPYLSEGCVTNTSDYDLYMGITLGEDEYFFLGDNRPISLDSRSLGTCSRSQIVGVVYDWSISLRWLNNVLLFFI